MSDSVLSADTFARQFFSTASPSGKYLIAYSGGLDSHVLLHLFATLQSRHAGLSVRSIYIDHGLQPASTDWAAHCQSIAKALNCEHQTLSVQLPPTEGQSLEAVARTVRYRALAGHLQEDEKLLTAHHQNDQAETVLLQLLRGGGLDGLAAMPATRSIAATYHLRPLLTYSRAMLEAYAQRFQLAYITDPTNSESRFDRNFLRNEVIPLLQQRWPRMDVTLARVARVQAEAGSLLSSYIEDEMTTLTGSREGTLSRHSVNQLPVVKRKAVIRHWVKKSGFTVPSEKQLQHLLEDVFQSVLSATPRVHWSGVEVRRYRDDVYIQPPLPVVTALEKTVCIPWDLHHPLQIPGGRGVLQPDDLGELKKVLLERAVPVTVRFRCGGERLRPQHRKHMLTLKNLLQEKGIPPWQRARLPLIYANEQLICVPGVAQIAPSDLIL